MRLLIGFRYVSAVLPLLMFDCALAETAGAADVSSATTQTFQRDSRPVWEIGVGGGYSGAMDYPASSSRNNRTLFLPYAIYRGERFRVGSGRVRAVAVEKPRFSVDLSLGAAFNADSEGNSAREGMPDLDFLFELGPRLDYRIFDRPVHSGSRSSLSWETYLRAVMSTDFSGLDSRGVRVGSRLRYNYSNIGGSKVDFFTRFGPVWATEDLQDYFYGVDETFATDSRAAFNAGGGYLGSELFYGLRFHAGKNFRLILGSTLGYYDGAENRDSPLFESRRTVSYAMVMVWSIRQSRRSIDLYEED